jgi:hypothetical protein
MNKKIIISSLVFTAVTYSGAAHAGFASSFAGGLAGGIIGGAIQAATSQRSRTIVVDKKVVVVHEREHTRHATRKEADPVPVEMKSTVNPALIASRTDQASVPVWVEAKAKADQAPVEAKGAADQTPVPIRVEAKAVADQAPVPVRVEAKAVADQAPVQVPVEVKPTADPEPVQVPVEVRVKSVSDPVSLPVEVKPVLANHGPIAAFMDPIKIDNPTDLTAAQQNLLTDKRAVKAYFEDFFQRTRPSYSLSDSSLFIEVRIGAYNYLVAKIAMNTPTQGTVEQGFVIDLKNDYRATLDMDTYHEFMHTGNIVLLGERALNPLD